MKATAFPKYAKYITHGPKGHIDIDSFFISVEMRDRPELTKVPCATYDSRRGTPITSANYLAKSLGIDSAMRVEDARKICPDLWLVEERPEEYKKVSDKFFTIIKRRAGDRVELYSADEAFVDLSKHSYEKAADWTRELIKELEDELRVPISGSVAPTKWLNKMMTNYVKPHGFDVLKSEADVKLFYPLKVEKFHGIKEKTGKKLRKFDIETIGDIANAPLTTLTAACRKTFGKMLYYRMRGDKYSSYLPWDYMVIPWYVEIPATTIGNTIKIEFQYPEHIKGRIRVLCSKVSKRMEEGRYDGRTLTLGMRFEEDGNLKWVEKSKSLPAPRYFHEKEMLELLALKDLFDKIYIPKKRVGRVGLRVSNLVRGWSQLRLL
ncbi:MAG: hypothetical protein QMD14_04500 [Candidatus Aenigmarchaeota archaeon]|nr:hypothetical protein [Candidatus Aenigmarchaeota archaeon]